MRKVIEGCIRFHNKEIQGYVGFRIQGLELRFYFWLEHTDEGLELGLEGVRV